MSTEENIEATKLKGNIEATKLVKNLAKYLDVLSH